MEIITKIVEGNLQIEVKASGEEWAKAKKAADLALFIRHPRKRKKITNQTLN